MVGVTTAHKTHQIQIKRIENIHILYLSAFTWNDQELVSLVADVTFLMCEGSFQHRHPSGDQRRTSDLRGNPPRLLRRVHRTTSTRKTFKWPSPHFWTTVLKIECSLSQSSCRGQHLKLNRAECESENQLNPRMCFSPPGHRNRVLGGLWAHQVHSEPSALLPHVRGDREEETRAEREDRVQRRPSESSSFLSSCSVSIRD